MARKVTHHFGCGTSRQAPATDFAQLYTSFLRQPGGLEVQLVTYDGRREPPSR